MFLGLCLLIICAVNPNNVKYNIKIKTCWRSIYMNKLGLVYRHLIEGMEIKNNDEKSYDNEE